MADLANTHRRDDAVPDDATVGQLLWSRWLHRKVYVPGNVKAVIEYDGRFGIGESVLVNGKLVAWDVNFWRFVSHFDFFIPTDLGPVRGSVDVRVCWLTLRALSIQVEGSVVYTEGSWQ